jgi:hypothetical protein
MSSRNKKSVGNKGGNFAKKGAKKTPAPMVLGSTRSGSRNSSSKAPVAADVDNSKQRKNRKTKVASEMNESSSSSEDDSEAELARMSKKRKPAEINFSANDSSPVRVDISVNRKTKFSLFQQSHMDVENHLHDKHKPSSQNFTGIVSVKGEVLKIGNFIVVYFKSCLIFFEVIGLSKKLVVLSLRAVRSDVIIETQYNEDIGTMFHVVSEESLRYYAVASFHASVQHNFTDIKPFIIAEKLRNV